MNNQLVGALSVILKSRDNNNESLGLNFSKKYLKNKFNK